MESTQKKSGDDVDDSVPKMEKDDEMPPDEHRCCQTAGGGWRCKNFRMNHGAADDTSVPKSKFCEKHYYGKKKTSGNGETRALKRGKKVTEKGETGGIQQINCDDDTADPIIECGSANIWRKRKTVERTKRSGELESLTRAKEGVVELEHYKIKCFELLLELERKNLECTKLQGKLAEVEETRKTAETEWEPADATASWEKMFSTMGCVESGISNLESLFLRMESKYSTMAGCVESGISKLESLVLRMENENSTMGC
ncbi:uncharacterized protein LOC113346784 isoform X1 [Papaver somniferum]|uniref:uncharacterized protein LOC113346784 isoform X1 n=1 Tax=Papaver somniferum TaxID=3469 RepID=UPI000E6FAFDC|nr:uncharacterized protein LOC113346784 isoform X1 [Papaver somniferum]XP_026446076.1 uncharacterized protein LOC113346784 isoform X1 [Papaver somniferum]XP_026446077.1 uncharacterized protein LOC113346784 isoform X1 [Papaver somniferum]XP_026446078.1 uncharacterized protein LOC113346784 isoform X1 [Papaver somniferum]XP_026446079.1 uncharacterized protein LOC113346784 isoform X1 [Papaver somniferum]